MNDQSVPMTPLQKAAVALKAQRARIAELEQAASAPIAVVGMGCRYAAGGDSPDALWQALAEGRDGSREVPKERWDVDAVYDPTPGVPGKMYVRKSCFIDGVDGFDPLFFRISPREAVGIDPQQRLLLEVAWEALEDAAIPPPSLVGSRTGVFLGISTNDYSALLSRTAHGSGSNATAGAGNAASVASGRLSYSFGFQGPCMAIDTACSSSLVATHLAVKALRNRECNLALVAGVNLMLAPDITINFCQGRMLSPDGACKTFDADADGYVRGEGCGVVVLKRLADALADGDRVLSVIRGTAVNQDGRSAGLTAPNGLAQEAVIRQALADARLEPRAVDAIEAHGTGTALGDPIEMHALKAVYGDRDRPLYVGSIKTNIGHTEAAAGVAGIIKAVLMLRGQAVPPSLHFTRLNPHIELGGADFRVPTGRVETRLDRVGVSSFGFSGTNVHVILEAPPRTELEPEAEPKPATSAAPRLLISARTPEALRALKDRYRRFLAETPDDFADICHTAAVGRARLPWWICVERPDDLDGAEASNEALPELPAMPGRKVKLPSYAFENARYWVDTTPGPEREPELPAGSHPLLGRRLSLPLSSETRWEAIGPGSASWPTTWSTARRRCRRRRSPRWRWPLALATTWSICGSRRRCSWPTGRAGICRPSSTATARSASSASTRQPTGPTRPSTPPAGWNRRPPPPRRRPWPPSRRSSPRRSTPRWSGWACGTARRSGCCGRCGTAAASPRARSRPRPPGNSRSTRRPWMPP